MKYKFKTIRFTFFFCGTLLQIATLSGQDLGSLGDQKPIKLSGGIALNTTFYNVNGIDNRQSPFSYSISGSPVLTFYGISMPFSFHYSDEQSKFSQPFNRFGISPHYKWIKVHAGHRNVRFSPYTLNGHNFFGAGIELTPGILRFGVVSGRFKKAVEEVAEIPQDSSLYRPMIPSYKRNGFAIKLGIGSRENYLDFIFLQARDDATSLENEPVIYDVEPAENAVFGISKKITILESLTWNTDLGISLYTSNSNLEAFNDSSLVIYNVLSRFITPNSSTQLLFAGETRLKLSRKTFDLQFKYKRVDPEYKSMGLYYMQGDLSQYTISPSFRLFKNKLIVSGSLGKQKDNLYAKKALQTGRTISSANISLNPGQIFGMNFMYSNYGFKQNPSGLQSQYADSMLIYQVSQNISLMPRLTFVNEKASHVIFLSLSYQELRNRNLLNNMVQDMTSVNTSLNYSYYHIATGFTISPVLYINSTSVEAGKLKSIGPSVSMSKSFSNNRIRSSLSFSYTVNSFDGESNGHTGSINGSVHYSLTENRKHSLLLNFNRIKNVTEQSISSGLAQTNDFKEFTASFGYNYNF